MPKQINVPGMGVVNFPDDMDDDAIASAIQKNMPKPVSVGEDFKKSVDAGAASGVAIAGGALGDLTDLGARGIAAATRGVNAAGQYFGLPAFETRDYDPSKTPLQAIPTSKSVSESIQKDYYGGEKPYEPQYKPGKIGKATAELAISAPLGPGGAIAKTLATVGGGVGQVYGGDLATSLLGEQARPYGEFAGTVVGGMTPNAMARTITPNPSAASRQRLVDVLGDEGVTSITAGQRTGNRRLQYAEDALGNAPGSGGKAERITREGQEQFSEAAMRRAGAGPSAAPEIVDANMRRLGDTFTDLSSRNNLIPDRRFATDVMDAVRGYQRVPPSQQRAMVEGYVNDIMPHIQSGQMPGAMYQEMRSRLSKQSNSLRQSDPTLSETLRGIRDALDDAMGRSISPADQQAWQTARQQWGAQKTINKAASKAGEATQEGQIVPANLRNVVAAENRDMYARGGGQFGELARAGSGVMAPLPNSGTAQRHNLLSLANQATFGVPAAAIGRVLMSAPAQRYLGNQVMSPERIAGLPSKQQALLRALLAQDRLSGPSN